MGAKRNVVAEWRRKALRLHLAGLSFQQVAEALNKKAVTVRKGIEAELADETSNYKVDIKRERAVKCAQLDGILRGNMQRASAGDINASFVCLAVIKEQVRINGLAAPQKVDVDAKMSLTFDAKAQLLQRLENLVTRTPSE